MRHTIMKMCTTMLAAPSSMKLGYRRPDRRELVDSQTGSSSNQFARAFVDYSSKWVLLGLYTLWWDKMPYKFAKHETSMI